MLNGYDRLLLTQAIVPPTGYALDEALGNHVLTRFAGLGRRIAGSIWRGYRNVREARAWGRAGAA